MATTRGRASGYDREAADAARQATLETMHTQLAEKVAALASGDAWASWLRFANSFHRYSFSNTLLIWSQKPQATMVAGYRAWQARGRQVRRGETAIKVYGPVTRRDPKLDPQGRPVRDAAGQPVTEVRMVGVKPVSVFDVSQTDGDPLPEPPEAKLLTGEAPPGLWDALKAFVEAQGYTVSRGDCDGANGVTIFDTRQVRVRADLDDSAACKTLCHEAAHAVLHHPERREPLACRGVVEVEAESVAYLVAAAHGLNTSQYTFNYVAGWAHQAATSHGPSVEDIIKATGQRVISTADRILQTTQPAPTLADDALADLTVQVTRPLDAVTVTPQATSRAVGVDVQQLAAAAVGVREAITPTPPFEAVDGGGRTRSASASPVAVWERVESRPLDGAARERRALPRTAPAPTYTVSP